MAYTVFEYLYRDASNYKAFGEVWLAGAISEDERKVILRSFDSGEFFVAEQVGIPPLYRELFEYSGGRTDDDHAWHSFEGLRFEDAPSSPLRPLPIILGSRLAKFASFIATDPSLRPSASASCLTSGVR